MHIDDYDVKILRVRDDYHKDMWKVYIPNPPWEMMYLDMARVDNEDLVNHLIDARDSGTRLKLSLNVDDKKYAYFSVVEYIFDHDGTINLALHLCQELGRNDAGELCFRAVAANE